MLHQTCALCPIHQSSRVSNARLYLRRDFFSSHEPLLYGALFQCPPPLRSPCRFQTTHRRPLPVNHHSLVPLDEEVPIGLPRTTDRQAISQTNASASTEGRSNPGA